MNWMSPYFLTEYVVATVDVKEQKSKLFLDKNQVEEHKYRLR
jgi:putative transposase